MFSSLCVVLYFPLGSCHAGVYNDVHVVLAINVGLWYGHESLFEGTFWILEDAVGPLDTCRRWLRVPIAALLSSG